jgi:hypothetical protein
MPTVLLEQFPEIFSAAIKSPLGVFAMLACGVGLLAWYFFGKENSGVKLAVFVLIFGGVGALGYAIFQKASNEQKLVLGCVTSALDKLQDRQTKTVRNQVRCEGGGIGGTGQDLSGVVAFTAPPGYVIVGQPEIVDVHQSRGSQGDLQFTRVGEATTGVKLPITCSSPAQVFGPGAWMGATLRTTIERPVQDSERARIQKECSASVS